MVGSDPGSYQATSWEYVQFLYLANDGRIAHLAGTGADLLDAWLATAWLRRS